MRLISTLLVLACVAACSPGSPSEPRTPLQINQADTTAKVGNTDVHFGTGGAPQSFSAQSEPAATPEIEGFTLVPEGVTLPGTELHYHYPSVVASTPGSKLDLEVLVGVLKVGGIQRALDLALNGDLDQGTASLHGDLPESGRVGYVKTGVELFAELMKQSDGTTDARVGVKSDAMADLAADAVRFQVDGVDYDLGPLLAGTPQDLSRVVEDVKTAPIGVTIEKPRLEGSVVGFQYQQAKGSFFYRAAAQPVVIDVGTGNEACTPWVFRMYNDTHAGNELGPTGMAFNVASDGSYDVVSYDPLAALPIAKETRATSGRTFVTAIVGNIPSSGYARLQQTSVFEAIVAGGEWGLSISNYDNAQQVYGPDVVVETNNITDVFPKAGDPASGILVYADNTADAIKFVERNAQNEYATAPAKTITNAAWPGASGKVVSAVQKGDGSILFITDGQPGELWFLAAGATVATKIADVGDSPRRVRCAGNIAAVSAFGSGIGFGALSFFVKSGSTWTGAPFSLVGPHCIGIDAKVLPSGNVSVVSTLYFSHQFRVTTLDNSNGEILKDDVLDLPAACRFPGHAAWVPDDILDHRVLVSCNGSDNVAIMPTVPE